MRDKAEIASLLQAGDLLLNPEPWLLLWMDVCFPAKWRLTPRFPFPRLASHLHTALPAPLLRREIPNHGRHWRRFAAAAELDQTVALPLRLKASSAQLLRGRLERRWGAGDTGSALPVPLALLLPQCPPL